MRIEIDKLEERLSLANNELLIKYQKIKVLDEKLDEADYGVKRRRGTLITLQKMSEDRTSRIDFEKLGRKKVDIYRNANEGKKKYIEKWKLDFQRRLFDYKMFEKSVVDRGLAAQNVIKNQKCKISKLDQRCLIEKHVLKNLSTSKIKL